VINSCCLLSADDHNCQVHQAMISASLLFLQFLSCFSLFFLAEQLPEEMTVFQFLSKIRLDSSNVSSFWRNNLSDADSPNIAYFLKFIGKCSLGRVESVNECWIEHPLHPETAANNP
jgi:hypothetical protein